MITTTQALGRREVLKGLTLGVGSLLLAPLFQRLQAAESAKAGPIAPRFLFVIEGSGMHPAQIAPKAMGLKMRGARHGLERFAINKDTVLPPALEPLAAYKNRLNIVQGLSGKVAGGGHSSNQGALGCYNAVGGSRIVGPTIDSVLGHHFPGILPNIVLGLSSTEDPIAFNCSASGINKAQATLMRPDQAYSRLFGSVAKDRARAVFNARNNLLDFMVDDIRRSQRALGQDGKGHLDAYLESYEELSQIDKRMASGRERLAAADPGTHDDFTSASRTHRLRAHFNLASASMIGGLSNVVTIASGVGFTHFDVLFDDIGFDTEKVKGGFTAGGKHIIGHQVGTPEKPNLDSDGYKAQVAIRRFHIQQIADFLERLAKIPEGKGTMADNTVVVYLSDAAETHHSSMVEWPMLVVGDLKGALKSGQMLVYPNYGRAGHGTTSRLYCSLLHAAGKRQESFGEVDTNLDPSMQKGPLKELLS